MQIQVGSFERLQGFTLLIGHQLSANNAQLVTCIKGTFSQANDWCSMFENRAITAADKSR